MEDKALTILMVEDNLDHIELVRRAFELANRNDQFYAFCTLREALHWLQGYQPDVVIADLHLPDGSGLWDALTSDRPYRPAWTKEAAKAYIQNQAGSQFDPQVVETFLRLLACGEIE